jgi:predicted Zn finger-like uncharacterized protein
VFTQCPQCETVFRLSADVLGAAGGQVRCGRCGEVFDALKRLSEEPRMFTIGETTLELEARAEQILESLDEAPGAEQEGDFESPEGAGPGTASLEIQDLPDDSAPDQEPAERDLAETDVAEPEVVVEIDRSLEFTLAPTELDRIFVEAEPGTSFSGEEDAMQDERRADAYAIAAERLSADAELPAEGIARNDVQRLALSPDEMLLTPGVPAAERRARALWIVAAVILMLMLAAQVVHRNREWLASRPPLGLALRALYADLGNPLPVPATLSGYQLRQWGASGDTAANGALRVRASILNTSSQMQPYPLLRVTLADRFGAHLNSRSFEPAEYLGKPATRLLNPGERVDATVEIQDPGKNAEGFELDVCLRGADGMIRCASDAAPRPR